MSSSSSSAPSTFAPRDAPSKLQQPRLPVEATHLWRYNDAYDEEAARGGALDVKGSYGTGAVKGRSHGGRGGISAEKGLEKGHVDNARLDEFSDEEDYRMEHDYESKGVARGRLGDVFGDGFGDGFDNEGSEGYSDDGFELGAFGDFVYDEVSEGSGDSHRHANDHRPGDHHRADRDRPGQRGAGLGADFCGTEAGEEDGFGPAPRRSDGRGQSQRSAGRLSIASVRGSAFGDGGHGGADDDESFGAGGTGGAGLGSGFGGGEDEAARVLAVAAARLAEDEARRAMRRAARRRGRWKRRKKRRDREDYLLCGLTRAEVDPVKASF